MSEAPAERRRSPSRRSVRGQSLVEFALILPILLVVVLAAVDFGWALRSFITATNAAREGARLGVVGANATEITTKTVETSSGVLSAGDVSVSGAGGAPGSTVTVSVTYDYHYITPLGGLISFLTGGSLPNPLPFSTSTTMRIE